MGLPLGPCLLRISCGPMQLIVDRVDRTLLTVLTVLSVD